MNEQSRNIDEIFELGKPIDEAINNAMREAVKRHRQANQPVVGWENGHIVWVQPKDLAE